MATYRESREARAERLREWSAKRAEKAEAGSGLVSEGGELLECPVCYPRLYLRAGEALDA